MRPERLELEGFTTFRARTVVTFAGCDLFAFTGPTGAGKSSLIDAMLFALYGSVPRHDLKTVAPLIAQGELQARVRLDFRVGDATYTAVRVVSRVKDGGATTKEARLERNGSGLAGNARELNAAVEKLLGLDFNQFTTCVVLPQGEFARFLHEKPADRQELLVRLLGLDLYRDLARRAGQRQKELENRRVLLGEQVAELAEMTPEAEQSARDASHHAQMLQEAVAKLRPEYEAIDGQARDLERQQAERDVQLKALEAVRVPDAVRTLAARLAEATATAEAAGQQEAQAVKAQQAAVEARTALGDAAALHRLQAAHADLAGRRQQHAQAAADEAAAMQRHEASATALAHATTQHDAATKNLAAAQSAHLAAVLAAHLVEGEPCAVCQQRVERLPHVHAPPALAGLEKAWRAAEAAASRAQAAANSADAARQAALTRVTQLVQDMTSLEARLATAPSAAEVDATLVRITGADRHVAACMEAARKAHDAAGKARVARDRVAAEQTRQWPALNATRDALAALSPPAADPADLLASWLALADWAAQARPALAQAHATAKSALADCNRARAALDDRLRGLFAAAGLPFDARRQDATQLAAQAVADARAEQDRVTRGRQRRARLEADAEAASEQATVARTLAGHLRTDHFERWLLEHALDGLASGASTILLELSNGQYALAHAQGEFAVIDHRNAGERRPVSSLSGGETFLASLALALALADQVRGLAADGAARLESMFLDEGFGALDAESLELVAPVLEELGSRGRMVGIVTHVQELASRLPVQFRVGKGPATSTVTRSDGDGYVDGSDGAGNVESSDASPAAMSGAAGSASFVGAPPLSGAPPTPGVAPAASVQSTASTVPAANAAEPAGTATTPDAAAEARPRGAGRSRGIGATRRTRTPPRDPQP
jgi:exonuclease SbcC